MRNMYPDSEYFKHLDELRLSGEWNSVLAPVSLMDAFPGLRADEARAVCNDWRATYHERRTRPAPPHLLNRLICLRAARVCDGYPL